MLCISLLLHLGVIAWLYFFPPVSPAPKEPVFIDLQQMPEPKTIPKPEKLRKIPEPEPVREPKKEILPLLSDREVKVKRETAPREDDTGKFSTLVPTPQQSKKQQSQSDKAKTGKAELAGKLLESKPIEQKGPKVLPGSSAASLLKPRQQSVQQHDAPDMFPKTEKLAKLEDDYRRRYERDVAEGESLILNTQESKLISFFRRFENAVYGVWHYPDNNMPGEVIYLITFSSSNGQVIDVQKMESSGTSEIDDAALKTIRSIGPLGALPKDFKKSEYKLFVRFIYDASSKKIIR